MDVLKRLKFMIVFIYEKKQNYVNDYEMPI